MPTIMTQTSRENHVSVSEHVNSNQKSPSIPYHFCFMRLEQKNVAATYQKYDLFFYFLYMDNNC